MAYPPGVTTCPVTIDAPVTFGGADATVQLEITPGVRLVWAATGQTFADFTELVVSASAGTATVTLPHSQPGFQDEAGNAVLSWPYTARIRYTHAGKTRHVPIKTFTIDPGTPGIDLALLPSGTAAPAVTTPNYLLVARDPESIMVGARTIVDGAITSSAVTWPDGTAGQYTGTPSPTFPGSIDTYTITYGTTRTYTQPAVTRDAAGNITNQPAIVLS